MALRRKQLDEARISDRLAAITQPSLAPGGRPAWCETPELSAPHPQYSAPQPIQSTPSELATLHLPNGQEIALLSCASDGEGVSIGRGEQVMIRLDDRHVSRMHAELRWDATARAHVIADCGSANGTYLDGVRVRRPMRLHDGARIRVGTTVLRYCRSHRS